MRFTTTRQMIAAEILKLRRNRALMAFAIVLTSGVLVIMFGYVGIGHATSPAKHGPAGGIEGFSHAVRILGVFFGMLAAILVGSEAGAADIASGVFRDLVATGRSRLALFGVRAPAAILVTLTISAIGFAVALAGTFVLADGAPTPSVGVILPSAAWIALCNTSAVLFAVGVGSLTGSRAITLTSVIGWQTIATQLLSNIGSLGHARDALLTPALNQLMPVTGGGNDIKMATGIAVAVLIGWAALPTVIGAFSTATRDA